MKLHYKIILMPTIIITIIFIVSTISIEYHLKQTLRKQFEQKLGIVASFSLSAIDPVANSTMLTPLNSSLNILAHEVAQSGNARITYFNKNGTVLGDSKLTFEQVLNSSNYKNRREIIAALNKGLGIATRVSTILQSEMIYVAIYDAKSGYIARASLPLNTFDSAILNLRLNFIFIIVLILAVTIIFGLLTLKLIRKAVLKERESQESIVITRTREITLLQTMTTLLQSTESMGDAAHILSKIVPKLLPSLSGRVFFLNDDDVIQELTQWGDCLSCESKCKSTSCWHNKFNKFDSIQSNSAPYVNKDCSQSEHLICINLCTSKELLGGLQFISKDVVIGEELRLTALSLSGQISGALANIRLKIRLRNQAARDPLTNLYNRRFMLESFEQALNRAERHERKLAVLMIDLDLFKKFNDNFGHEAGDMVLQEVAKQFKENLRLEDIASRYGGEEFCIVCPDTGLREAFVLAEKLRCCISKRVLTFNSIELESVTMSIGIAIYPNHALTSTELMAQADKALYVAKRKGRDCTVVAQLKTPQQQGN
jgi:diguanylate cyclase (GGDEF)-like protein